MSTENTSNVSSIPSQPQPKKFWRKVICWLPVIIVVAVPVWYFCLHTTPLEISTETTYVTAPLTADGKRIDYFLAMEERYYPPEMQTDDNGYRMIVRACGDLAEHDDMVKDKDGNWKQEKIESNEVRLQTYEKLGLDPNVKPTLKLESPDTVFRRLHSEQLKVNANAPDELGQKYYRPYLDFWTFDDFPILETWLTENTAGLDLLGEAVRKPTFRIPFVRKNENSPIVNMFFMSGANTLYREFARALSGRARYRIGIGDIDGAIYDKMTIHYIARHAAKSGGMVGGLVGIAIEGIAAATAIGANPDHPLTKEQLEKLMTEIDALPPQFTLTECIETERFFCLGNFQDMYWDRKSALGYKYYGLYLFPNWYCDFNIALRRWNKMFDTLVDGTFTGDNVKYNPLSNITVHGRSEVFAIDMFNQMKSSSQASGEAWRRADCMLNMQRLTLALLLYEKEHGSLPDGDWRTAITPYLGDKPEQYFHCPSSESSHGHIRPVTHVYALIKYDGQAPSAPDTMLLVETIAQNVNENDGTVPNSEILFESFHTGGYNTSFRNGAIRFQSVPVTR